MINDLTSNGSRKKLVPTEYLIAFILVTSPLFFMGFAHSLLDVLNKHFQDILELQKQNQVGYRQLYTEVML